MKQERAYDWEKQFSARGFAVVPGVFESWELGLAREAQEAFYRGEYDRKPQFAWPLPRLSRQRQRRHPYACFFQSGLSALSSKPRLVKVLARLGDGTVRRWFDQLLWNEPLRVAEGAAVDWHIEQSRWQTCRCDLMATVWIPLEPISQEMGPITMRDADSGELTPLKIPEGGVGIFHWRAKHGNPPNLGRRIRRALAVHYALGDVSYKACGSFKHINERICRKKNGVPDFSDGRVCPLLASPAFTSLLLGVGGRA